MRSERPFRFGLIVDTLGATRPALVELAKRAEDAGVSILLAADHLGRAASLPLLQAAIEATDLRLGSFVINNDFRHPLMLAQELAAIDIASEGRLEIGFGAGWNQAEYPPLGIAFDDPERRVRRLATAIGIVRQALSDGVVNHEGDDDYPPIRAVAMPKSVQRPHPPFLIGGGSERILRLAAEAADIVSLNPRARQAHGLDAQDVTAAAIDDKVRTLRAVAEGRATSLELNIVVFEPDSRLVAQARLSPEEMRRSPHFLIDGPGERAVDQLLESRERWGITYFALRPSHLPLLKSAIPSLPTS